DLPSAEMWRTSSRARNAAPWPGLFGARPWRSDEEFARRSTHTESARRCVLADHGAVRVRLVRTAAGACAAGDERGGGGAFASRARQDRARTPDVRRLRTRGRYLRGDRA